MGGMLVYSHSASHFGAFVQASDPLQGVMTSGLCYMTPDNQIILKESGHLDCVTSVRKCNLQMKLWQVIGQTGQCFNSRGNGDYDPMVIGMTIGS